MILDNNLLFKKEVFLKTVKDIVKEGIIPDFSQGLDIRLVTDEIAKALKSLKTSVIRFSFDNVNMFPLMIEKLDLVMNKYHLIPHFYLLQGYNTTYQEDYDRIKLLHFHGVRSIFVMSYGKSFDNPISKMLYRWAAGFNRNFKISFYDFAILQNKDKSVERKSYLTDEQLETIKNLLPFDIHRYDHIPYNMHSTYDLTKRLEPDRETFY